MGRVGNLKGGLQQAKSTSPLDREIPRLRQSTSEGCNQGGEAAGRPVSVAKAGIDEAMSKLRLFLLPSLAGIALAALAVLGCIAFSDMMVAPPPLEGEVPSAASILADPKVCPSHS